MIGYIYSDWIACMDDRKSTSGYPFNTSSAKIAWSVQKQPIVSFFTTEVDYKATSTTICEAI